MITALITGASGGIGYEMAKVMAADGVNLVLTARSEDKLLTLRNEIIEKYNVKVYVIKLDLSLPNAALQLKEFTDKNNLEINYLVNNAGFSHFGLFHETGWQRNAEIIQVNITALTQLTRLYLPQMVKNNNGKILNIGSTASFAPGPFMSVYNASKAYVLSFSEALSEELRGTKVTVTALCPGPTETGFEQAAAMEKSNLFKIQKVANVADVVKFGYKAMLRGDAIALHGFMNNVMIFGIRFSPRWLVRKIVRKITGPA